MHRSHSAGARLPGGFDTASARTWTAVAGQRFRAQRGPAIPVSGPNVAEAALKPRGSLDEALVHAERRLALAAALGALPERHRALMQSLLAEPERT